MTDPNSATSKIERGFKNQLSNHRPGPVILWFRRDLRLRDNPALAAACESGREIFCIYIDEDSKNLRSDGGATRWWLHHSLAALDADLKKKGAGLHILKGDAATLIPKLAKASEAAAAVWNRRYDEADRALDAALKTKLEEAGLIVKSFNGHLLYEPWEVKSKTGTPMKVFTPFWRAAQAVHEPAEPLKLPEKINGYAARTDANLEAVKLADLNLLPTKPDWAGGLDEEWQPGEAGAKKRLETFLMGGIAGYAEARNLPAEPSTSKLSPHLKFGEISPRQIWAATKHAGESQRIKGSEKDRTVFLTEIGWREFSYHLLFYFPQLATKNFNPKFDRFAWEKNAAHLRAWQKGETGYPIVDAGMRQLWQTGWMHNRIRMVTASFLIKHLMIDWRVGEDWFWDTLVDSDPASNTASWQWVAGSGADAAPYFRIFNPVTQGEKFDAEGAYVRRFVPELSRMPSSHIHKPWEASAEILGKAGVVLGRTYPKPIVDHAAARDKALKTFQAL